MRGTPIPKDSAWIRLVLDKGYIRNADRKDVLGHRERVGKWLREYNREPGKR